MFQLVLNFIYLLLIKLVFIHKFEYLKDDFDLDFKLRSTLLLSVFSVSDWLV